MRTIWKYPLALTPVQTVAIPAFHRHRHFAMQGDVPTIWVEVLPKEVPVVRTFFIVGTGGAVPDNSTFVGTVLAGEFVWHLYEENL